MLKVTSRQDPPPTPEPPRTQGSTLWLIKAKERRPPHPQLRAVKSSWAETDHRAAGLRTARAADVPG